MAPEQQSHAKPARCDLPSIGSFCHETLLRRRSGSFLCVDWGSTSRHGSRARENRDLGASHSAVLRIPSRNNMCIPARQPDMCHREGTAASHTRRRVHHKVDRRSRVRTRNGIHRPDSNKWHRDPNTADYRKRSMSYRSVDRRSRYRTCTRSRHRGPDRWRRWRTAN